MPSLEACRALSGPNKSDWVVYHKRLNVNLAKPAAIAVVWRGMSVITQTDRHKYTQKSLQEGNSAIKNTNKHSVFFMINTLRPCFHVVSYKMMPLKVFLIFFFYRGWILLVPLTLLSAVSLPFLLSIFFPLSGSMIVDFKLPLNFIIKPHSAHAALVASCQTHM